MDREKYRAWNTWSVRIRCGEIRGSGVVYWQSVLAGMPFPSSCCCWSIPTGVRPICLVRLIESHAPLLRFAFAIFSCFLITWEKSLSPVPREYTVKVVFYLFWDRLDRRFVFEGNLLFVSTKIRIANNIMYKTSPFSEHKLQKQVGVLSCQFFSP